MRKKLILYWVRRDFRLTDNRALVEAVKRANDDGNIFLPIFILENYMIEAHPKFQFGYPSRYFLAHAIPHFTKHFKEFVLVRGKVIGTFKNIQKEASDENLDIEIHVNEDVYIDFYKQVDKIKALGISIRVQVDQLTIIKETVSGTGNLYAVFTPFKKAVWKGFLQSDVLEKVDETILQKLQYPSNNFIEKIDNQVKHDKDLIWSIFSQQRTIEVINHESNKVHHIDIDKHVTELPSISIWYITEDEALSRLDYFVTNLIASYKENRDSLENDVSMPEGTDLQGMTSKLSVALAWGLISARKIKEEIQNHFDDDFVDINWFDKNLPEEKSAVLSYLSELIWREFYKYLMYHNHDLMFTEFQEKFRNKVKWADEEEAMKRFILWIKGETGYKVVDAAMMQLAKTGWMHNRSRMIVASVLTKNLGVDWRWGQEYFRAMLIDLDEASNNGGWQWGASVGADPKPIRIFNPYLQAVNYDKNDLYQKEWLGEEKFFFGPGPIVEHKIARNEALKRYGLEKTNPDAVRDY